ncbi:MAG: hypothetical protein D6772_15600 [Bacteroidetes bacterium]|nr:MAG: hypothetical protein D6772_15600 [Bacteroidota bacterium]
MRIFLLLLTLCSVSRSVAQYFVPSVAGQWVGQITQNDGGYLPNYSYELFFQVEDGRIYGRSYVRAPGVEGVMQFSVEKRGEVFYIQEEELLQSRKPQDLSWCFKTMQLRLVQRGKRWYLEGPWQGQSEYGECIPGWLVLEPAVPRA